MDADSVPAAGVIVHKPTFGLLFVVVALFEKLAAPPTADVLSLFRKPVIVAVNGGTAVPYVMVFASAVTVSAALFTVRVPGVKVKL